MYAERSVIGSAWCACRLGSHTVSQSWLRRRTSLHSRKSLADSGRSMTRLP